jgi:uncharacterized protein
MQELKLSVFGHMLEDNNIGCAYHALTMHATYIELNKYKRLLQYIDGDFDSNLLLQEDIQLLDVLKNEKIVVPVLYDEKKMLNEIIDKAFDGVHIRVMVLHMTDFCNLACKYCFIEGNIPESYTRMDMTKEVAQKAIDKFEQILVSYTKEATPAIVFYGGEPLANWEVMKYSLEYLIDKGLSDKIDKILITNGILLTDEIAYLLKEHQVHVSLSIDGNETHTNVNRVYRDGKGAFSEIIKSLDTLRRHEIEPSVSCVLAKENVDYAEEIIKYFVEDLRIRSLGFNHVSIVPNLNYYNEEYESSFADALLHVQDYIQDQPVDIYERRMNHKINCYLDKQLLRADCTGCGEQMSISPLGEIGICQGYMGSRKTFNNTVFDPNYYPDKDPVFIEWSKRSPLTMPECYNCIALATCGGGCPRNADVLLNSIWKQDIAFCHFAKKAQEWLIWHDTKNVI